ncbi:Urease operon transcriptional activator [compost metagenome]
MNIFEQFEYNSSSYPVMKVQQLIAMYARNLSFGNHHNHSIFSVDNAFSINFFRKFINEHQSVYTINFDLYVQIDESEKSNATWSYIHKHDYIELGYIVKGEFNLLITGQEHTFKAGDVYIIDLNSEHAESLLDQDCFVVYLCMKEEFFDDLFISEIEGDNVQLFIRKALMKQKNLKQYIKFSPRYKEDLVYSLIEQVAIEHKEKRKGSFHIIKGLIIRIFYTLTNQYELSLKSYQTQKINQLLFIQVEDYLRQNYKEASIKRLVEKFHFQEDYFTRLIKKQTGMSFSQLLLSIRLAKVVELLQHTNSTVSHIIESVGYESRNYFYSIFKKQYGMTPERFRLAQRSAKKSSRNSTQPLIVLVEVGIQLLVHIWITFIVGALHIKM